ncbi:MAG: beta-ketoacyl synthase chain length factor [Steroidobacteraceae bacterium]
MSGAARSRESPAPALSAYLEGVGLLGPGLTDWRSGAPVIAGEAPYQPCPAVLPAPQALPPAERRRTGATVKLAIGVAQQAVAGAAIDPARLAAVFASSGGDGFICHEICETLATDDRQISPTRFHNSVHNAAAGYWSISTGATAASSALCAHDASFAAGLIETLIQIAVSGEPALLAAYETSYPEPLRAKRPIPDAFGTALVLTPQPQASSLARLTAALIDASADAPADRMADPRLEALRAGIPAARSLPLLRLIARRESGRAVLEYLPEQHLAVEVSACR